MLIARNFRHRFRIAPAATLALLTSPCLASVIIQTVEVPYTDAETVYAASDAFDPNAGLSGNLLQLQGINKFDPALGTLDQIIIRVQLPDSILYVDAAAVYSMEIDEGGPVSFDFFPGNIIDGGIFYLPSNDNWIISTSVAELFLDSNVEDDLDPAGTYDNTFQSESVDLQDFAALMDDPNFYLPDFVGSGEVSTLSVGAFLPNSAQLDNLSANILSLEVFAQIAVNDGFMEIEYHYTPVPEPKHFTAIFSLLVVAALVRRRGMAVSVLRNPSS